VKLSPGDSVVGAVHPADDDGLLLVVQAKGGGKRVSADEFPVQGRGGKGVKCAVVNGRTGPVVAACGADDGGTVTVRDAEGAASEVSVGAFALTARDGASAKIRNFPGTITEFITG